MPVTFTGTNTGNTYVAGQQYVSAGRVYTANPDGTFSRPNADGSIRSTVGSSQDPRVTFGTTGGGSVGPGAPRTVAGATGTGPGNPGVIGAGGRPVGGGAGLPPTIAGRVAAAGVMPRTTQLWVGGYPLARDLGTSDAQDFEDRYGDSEFLSPTWFATWGIAGRDAEVNLREWERAIMPAVTSLQDGGGAVGVIQRGVQAVREAPVPYARQPAFTGSDEFGFANPRY